MAEPVPNLTDDESVDGLTDSDMGENDATSDYGSGEQQHVSDRSEEESSEDSDDDGEDEDDDYGDGNGEGGEVMEDALATQDSDAMREEGNALFKEKKYKEAVEKYKTAADIGEGCKIGLDSGWQGLIKAYCNIAHCLNLLGNFREAERFCIKAMDLDSSCYKSYLRLSVALMGQDKNNLHLAICALCKGKELPGLHDIEIALFRDELMKLGVLGGMLTQAGRELNMKEVLKRGVHGPPLYTTYVSRAAPSSGFAFNFGSGYQPRQPGPAPKLAPGKKSKETGGRSEEDLPGLDDESSDSSDDSHIVEGKALAKAIPQEKTPDAKLAKVGKEYPPVEPKFCQGEGDHKEEFETGARPKKRMMMPCERKGMEMYSKDSKDEEKKKKVEKSTAWAEYTAQKKKEEEDKTRTERLLEKAKKEKDERRRIEGVLNTVTDRREEDDFERLLLEGDFAFEKGQMQMSRELHTKVISMAPRAWRSSLEGFVTRYQLARSCIEVASPSSLAQGYTLLKEMEEECLDEQHCRSSYRNAVYFLFALLFKCVQRRAEALKQLKVARHKVKSCKPLCRASDGLPLPESEPEYLRKEVAMLLTKLRFPEKPAAVCRHIGCIKLQEKQVKKPYLPLPTTSIYLSNPNHLRYITVTCFGSCDINFHTDCWEELKSGKLKCRSPRDKDFLGFLCPTPDCGESVIGVTVKGKYGEVEKQTMDSKIIEKLRREKREKKIEQKKEINEKEEAIKRLKLEEKVTKMRMKAQSLKAVEGEKGKKSRAVQMDAIMVSRSSEEKNHKVDGKVGEATKGAGIKKQTVLVAMAKQKEVAERRSEDWEGGTFENMKEVEETKQEEIKLEKMTDEGGKRVAFLLKLACKLRAQLQASNEGKGTPVDDDWGIELQDGKPIHEEKLSAIESDKQEIQKMASLEAKHLEEHNIKISELRQKLVKEMTEKTQLELELAFVKSQVEKLEKSEVSNKRKGAELKQIKEKLAFQSRRIVECEQDIQQSERECAIQKEQQRKMRLEAEVEASWPEQMRAMQVKQLEENYVEVRNQLKSRRDTAEKLLPQLSLIGDISATESVKSAVEQTNVALENLEEDFKEKLSTVGEMQPTTSLQFPTSMVEPQLSPALRLLLSLPQVLPASVPPPFGRQLKEDTALDAAPVKKGKAGMLELLCSRIPSLTTSAAEHYFAEVKRQHKGSLTGVPREGIVKEVETLLNQDLGRTDGNQETLECSICLENFTDVDGCTTLECGHIFHTSCIKNWMMKCKEGSGSTCPNCRFPKAPDT